MRSDRPKVTVLYNAPVLSPEHPDAASESDVEDVAKAVSDALVGAEFEVSMLAAGPPIVEVAAALDRLRPDVVFNLIEGFGGASAGATYVTALLDLAAVAYTGSSVECLALCAGKARTKALLRGLGLPTAPFVVVRPGEPVPAWAWDGPAIVKPDEEDGSLGIDEGSIVADWPAANERVARLHASYGGPVLLEAYLPGPEYNVGVVAVPDREPLPVAEVLFAPDEGAWPILTYAAKWSTGSVDDRASPVRCPARIDPELAANLGRLAVAAWDATGCRDYARIDIRLDAQGAPMILEVNPNPDIGPTAGWARAVRASGRDYAGTLVAIARVAMARGARGVVSVTGR